MPNEVQELVATASRVIGNAGMGDLIWGHASARDPEGKGAWLKQAGWGLEEITPELVQLVGPDGEVVAGAGPRHREYPIHTEIFRARPDVGGVVHVHSRYAVALAASGQPVLPVSHEGNYFQRGVPRFTETADLILTPELGAAVAAVLNDAEGCFLVNHGIVTVGPDLPSAAVAAVILERACEAQFLTKVFGGWPTWSGPDESRAKHHNIYESSKHAVFDYLVRGLPSV